MRLDPDVAEQRRLAALEAYDVLDTEPEVEFDDLAKLAAAVCGTPSAAVSLIDSDRQWFKAEVNVGARETPRELAFCAHTLHVPQIMVVPDATLDPRFADNALVTGPPYVRFYAGAVLRTAQGQSLGAVCALDTQPHPQGLTEAQADLLIGIARQVMAQLELRRSLRSERQERVHRDAADTRLAAALQATEAVGAWSWNVKTDRVVADRRFAEFFHLDPDLAAEGAPVEAFLQGIEEIDRAPVAAAIEVALRTGEPFEEEYRLRPAVGATSPRWVLARGRAIFDADGKPDRFPGAVVDITARKQVEEQARSTAVSLQVALRAARLGRWDHNPSTGARFYDERLRELFGLKPGEDRDFEVTIAHVHPGDQSRMRDSLRQAVDAERAGAFVEIFRVQAREGGWRWLEANGQSFFEFGRCTRFTGVMQDVTDRVEQAHEREEAALRLELALHAGGVGAWSFDPASQTIQWDSRTYELMGVPAGQPLQFGQDFIGRLHPDDRERGLATVSAAMAGDEYADDLRVRLPSGADRWLAFRGRRAPDRQEFIGTARDITAEKHQEEQRKLLADELRHRMKNLLAMVQSIGSQTLRTASTSKEAARSFSERLVALAAALDTLTERTWETAPVKAVIDAALAAHTDGLGRIEREGPDLQLGPKPALALTLALHELATNATKYGALAEPLGKVRLRWAAKDQDEDAGFWMEWREEGGPPVAPPARRSFGSRLIEANAGQEFGGEASLAFEPAGVVWTLRAPLAGLSPGAADPQGIRARRA